MAGSGKQYDGPTRLRTAMEQECERRGFEDGYKAAERDHAIRSGRAVAGDEVAYSPNLSGGGNACNTQAQAGRAFSQEERIAELFRYHAPREDQLPKYDTIRTAARHFAEILMKNTTYGADQSDALRKLRECVMTANASVALDGLS